MRFQVGDFERISSYELLSFMLTIPKSETLVYGLQDFIDEFKISQHFESFFCTPPPVSVNLSLQIQEMLKLRRIKICPNFIWTLPQNISTDFELQLNFKVQITKPCFIHELSY